MADQKISELASTTPVDTDNLPIERAAAPPNFKVSMQALRTWLAGFFDSSGSADAVQSNLDTHEADNTIHFTEASIDHGAIQGLADNDHPQYALLAASNTFTGGSQFIDESAGQDVTVAVTHTTRSDDAYISADGAESALSLRARTPANDAGMWTQWFQQQGVLQLRRLNFASGVVDDFDTLQVWPSGGVTLASPTGGEQGDGTLNAVDMMIQGERVAPRGPSDGDLYGMRDGDWEKVPASVAGYPYSFSNNTNTGQDPGSGTFRMNTAAWATVTQIAYDSLDGSGLNIHPLLLSFVDGDTLAIRSDTDVTRSATFILNGNPVDQTGYVQFNVTYVSDQGGAIPANNASTHLLLQAKGGSAGQSNDGFNLLASADPSVPYGGAVADWYAGKNNVTLEFRQLASSDGSVIFTQYQNYVDIAATGVGGGQANEGENLAGTGEPVYAGMNGVNLTFKRFAAAQFNGTATEISIDAAAFETTGAVVAHEGRVDDPHSAQGYVTGPASSVNNNLAAYNGITGKLIADSGKAAADIVTGPPVTVDENLAIYDGTTGKLIKDSSINVTDVGDVKGAAASLDSDIALFSGTTGKLLKATPAVNINDVLIDPMTANGDIIYQQAGVPAKLAVGTDTQVLTVVSGAPAWAAAAGGGGGPFTRRLTRTYALAGAITVQTALRFHVAIAPSGQALSLLGLIYQLDAGDSATVSVLVNGSPAAGLTGLSVTTTKGSTYIAAQGLSDEDALSVDITAVGATPVGISLDVVLQETLS
jgi:hypothetical protein